MQKLVLKQFSTNLFIKLSEVENEVTFLLASAINLLNKMMMIN